MLRFSQLFLSMIFVVQLCGNISAAHAMDAEQQTSSISVISPQKKISKAESAKIDTENLEIGFFIGTLSVEDFGTNQTQGITAVYHLTPDYFAQLSLGRSDVGRATFEDVVEQDFLSDEDEKFNYTQLAFAYQIFHGRSFMGEKSKFNSHIYLVAGLENVEFAGESNTGFVFGSTYKVVTTDWLTWNFELKNHLIERDFLSNKKMTNNIEFNIGFNALF
ncbi:outer membrane beta-barrel domain-containing protein [Aliikangiella marina]|uniref:Outer membrane beta-barrel domain-containing protein n=1 Tax=Aliikangiella marina TaxID=1712262 RepID=A0A545TID2_9GAMM|nr:outer membrane beta-barrel domain-containing protein [Aliikangiella marina]TQV76936.1 outer membrane beta-barrel domain-containing protein [Aliikangiella marina]